MIKERNPFPTIIGRICPRPCEDQCRRQFIDEPVAINFLKRFVADYEKAKGERSQPYKAPQTHRKIAVVGGGVEGLSTAFFSARLGHDITLFEAAPQLGGLLRSAIAAYRLPHEILDWDIEGIADMGVDMQTGKTLGEDFSVNSLLGEGYDAVFLALGGWDSRLLRGAAMKPETPIPGTVLLMDIMKASKAAADSEKIKCGSHTVIAGGGRFAVDAALQCKEMGAERVTIALRESLETAGLKVKADELKSQGIHLLFRTGISRLLGDKEDLTALQFIDLDSRETSTSPADMLVIAAGRMPEIIFARPHKEASEAETPPEDTAETTLWEGFYSSKHPEYSHEIGLLARGDVMSDYSGAIKAIGAGRRAAATIHQVMYGIEVLHPDNVLKSSSLIQNVSDVENVQQVPRTIMPIADSRERSAVNEIEKGFSEEMAQTESSRCLQCGLICYERTATGDMGRA